MTVKYLKTLLAVAKYGTFVAAAEELGLTPSAVSLQMKALQSELRTELFDRLRRPPVLNSRGEAVLEHARQIVSLYEQIGRTISESKDLSGKLNLGAVPTVQTGVLPDALLRLHRGHPRVQVRVITGLSAELTTMVETAELDAALVSQPMIRLPRRLVWYPFASEPLVVIAPIEAAGRNDRELLQSYPFIRFSRPAWAGRLIEKNLRRRRIKVSESMELDSLEAITLMASKGLGVSIVPRRKIEMPLSLPLKAVPFCDPPVRRLIGLVEAAVHPAGDLTKALLEELRLLSEYDTRNRSWSKE